MALITLPIASFNNDQVLAQIIYNDANLNITRVQVVNNSPYPATIWARDIVTLASGELTVAGNTTTSKAVSGLKYTIDPAGEMMLGNVLIGARWPS